MLPRVCCLPVAAFPLLGACFQSPGELEACTNTAPTYCDSSAAASTSTGQTATTEAAGSSAPTSGGSSGEDSGSSDAGVMPVDMGEKADIPSDAPPWVHGLVLDPPQAFELGPTLVHYQVSADAVSAQLLDDGIVIAEAPAGEPLVFPVTSAPHNNPGSLLTVVVRDEAGQIGTDEIFQLSNVKAPGSVVWTTQEPGDGQFSIGAGVALQGPLTVTAGVRWNNGKLVGTLRRYDQGGQWKLSDVGWTKDHPSWTTSPELASAQLSLSAVAVDAEGYIVAAGTALIANEQRMYLVRFKPDGALEWEVLEGVGTSGRGIAVQPDGTIYVTGSLITKAPEYTDLMTWVYDKDRTAHGPDQFNDPEDNEKKRSEHGRAVAVMKDGRVVVVGMAEIVVSEMDPVDLRTLAILYEGKGTRVGVWTSPGDKMQWDAGLAAIATEEGFALCGYAQDPIDPTNKTQILVRWLSADLEEVKAPRLELTPGSAQCNALAYNREGSLILGTEVIKGAQHNDIWIFAVRDAASPVVDYLKRNGVDNGDDRVAGLACDYMCGWVGAETVDGATQWIAGLIRG